MNTRSEETASRAWFRNITAWGGILATCGGFFHTLVAISERQPAWAQIIDEGFFNTITSDGSVDRLAVTEAYWYSVGSFGVPLLLLGALVIWLTRRGERVPVWLGCGVISWAVLIGLLGGFDSGTISLLIIGVLLAVGAWTNRHERTHRTRSA
jgi:hypothetical protein